MRLKLISILFFSIGFSVNCLIAKENNIIFIDERGIASHVDSDGMTVTSRFFDGDEEYLKLQRILADNKSQLEERLKREKEKAEKDKAPHALTKTETAYESILFRPAPIDPLLAICRRSGPSARPDAVIPPETYELANLRLKDDHQDWYYTGLSIDGGGIRGLIPASILEKVEEHLPKGQHVAEMFDAIGGISIGGILTLGLTVPASKNSSRAKYSATEMVDIFKKRGKDIFPVSFGREGIQKIKQLFITCGYPAEPLEKLLQEYFGDAHLSDAITHVLVGAVKNDSKKNQNPKPNAQGAVENTPNPTQDAQEKGEKYSHYLFQSLLAQNNPWEDYLMWQVGRSTSAAPSYFPNYTIRPHFNLAGTTWSSDTLVTAAHDQLMMDGGLWNNNPAEEVIKYIDRIASKISPNNNHLVKNRTLLFSLGTGRTKLEDLEVMPSVSSALRTAPAAILTSILARTNETHQNCSTILGPNYYRLTPKIDRVIDLADVSEETLDILEKSTDRYQEFCEAMARKLSINKDNRNQLDWAPL